MRLEHLRKTKSERAAEVIQTIMETLEQDNIQETERFKKVLNNFSLNHAKLQQITLRTSQMSIKEKDSLVQSLKKLFRYRAKHERQEIEFDRYGDIVIRELGIYGKLINPFLKGLRELQNQYKFTIKRVT